MLELGSLHPNITLAGLNCSGGGSMWGGGGGGGGGGAWAGGSMGGGRAWAGGAWEGGSMGGEGAWAGGGCGLGGGAWAGGSMGRVGGGWGGCRCGLENHQSTFGTISIMKALITHHPKHCHMNPYCTHQYKNLHQCVHLMTHK